MLSVALIVWIVIAIVAAIAEGATAAAVSGWFVVGAIVAAIAAAFGAPVWLQLPLFVVFSGVSLAVFRKYMIKGDSKKALALDNFAGMVESKSGTITETIPAGGFGQVCVDEDGMYWQARAVNDLEPIEKGTRVIVVKISGTCCIVTKPTET